MRTAVAILVGGTGVLALPGDNKFSGSARGAEYASARRVRINPETRTAVREGALAEVARELGQAIASQDWAAVGQVLGEQSTWEDVQVNEWYKRSKAYGQRFSWVENDEMFAPACAWIDSNLVHSVHGISTRAKVPAPDCPRVIDELNRRPAAEGFTVISKDEVPQLLKWATRVWEGVAEGDNIERSAGSGFGRRLAQAAESSSLSLSLSASLSASAAGAPAPPAPKGKAPPPPAPATAASSSFSSSAAAPPPPPPAPKGKGGKGNAGKGKGGAAGGKGKGKAPAGSSSSSSASASSSASSSGGSSNFSSSSSGSSSSGSIPNSSSSFSSGGSSGSSSSSPCSAFLFGLREANEDATQWVSSFKFGWEANNEHFLATDRDFMFVQTLEFNCVQKQGAEFRESRMQEQLYVHGFALDRSVEDIKSKRNVKITTNLLQVMDQMKACAFPEAQGQ